MKGDVNDDVQVQFYMVSPYVRKTMSTDQKGVYYTSLEVPDVYGVFQFKVEYEKSGVTSLSLAKQGDAKCPGSGASNLKPSAEGLTVQATDVEFSPSVFLLGVMRLDVAWFKKTSSNVSLTGDELILAIYNREIDRSCRFGFVKMSTVEKAKKVVVLYSRYAPSLKRPLEIAALASSHEVGSFMNIMAGLTTSSTAIVSLFCCSVDRPSNSGKPTTVLLMGLTLQVHDLFNKHLQH
ncbi:hypothetical protein T459_16573 [Capsicum annuum]|uniref:OST48 middle domain-containing protein n=1 Tax=Capsicum annuum TaxID=4072 RepID=A0A2G2Z9E7_CAPAN|nr:hypothetical protein T459_16573 [Capsicum annuum]